MDSRLPSWLQHWLRGVRLYLALSFLIVTAEVFWWGHTVYGASTVTNIRIEEVYAWLSTGLLAVALLIGPVTKLLPRLPGKQLLRDARRMVGIGSAWFAVLHAVLVYLQEFRDSNPLQLPRVYQQALLLGVIALVALLLLAFTSFDRVMKSWGIWWFRVHRLIYVSALAVLMHAFMIGTHAAGWTALISLTIISAFWVGCNLYFLLLDPTPSTWKLLALCYGTVLLVAVLNYGLSQHLGYNAVVHEHAGHQH